MTKVDKIDQFLRLLMLAKPDQYWPVNGLTTSEPNYLPKEQKDKLMTALLQKYASLTFGQLLTERFNTAGLSASMLANELGVPIEVVEYLAKDCVHPATIPIMVMKSLLERLNVSFAMARMALLASFEQLKVTQKSQPAFGFGMAARKATGLDGLRPSTGWDDSVGSEESLNQYLDRLALYMLS